MLIRFRVLKKVVNTGRLDAAQLHKNLTTTKMRTVTGPQDHWLLILTATTNKVMSWGRRDHELSAPPSPSGSGFWQVAKKRNRKKCTSLTPLPSLK